MDDPVCSTGHNDPKSNDHRHDTNLRVDRSVSGVVVLQPRMCAPEYQEVRRMHERGETNGRARRLQQLDALLLEAQSACRDLGADFLIIGVATLETGED